MLGFDYTMELDFGSSEREEPGIFGPENPYSQDVLSQASNHAFTLRCFPQELSSQHVLDFRILMEPQADLFYQTDSFGNKFCYGVIRENHSLFRVEVSGHVQRLPDRRDASTVQQEMVYRAQSQETRPGPVLTELYGKLMNGLYGSVRPESADSTLWDSSSAPSASAAETGAQGPLSLASEAGTHTSCAPAVETGVQVSSSPAAESGVHASHIPPLRRAGAQEVLAYAEAARDLVHSYMTYTPDSTRYDTRAEQAAKGKVGVCQDFSHMLLSLCRLAGIPARYTAGLLIGEGRSHAWVEVAAGGLWYPMDPTNPDIAWDQQIIFSHGRDAVDCKINRGTYYGPSAQMQFIRASVYEA